MSFVRVQHEEKSTLCHTKDQWKLNSTLLKGLGLTLGHELCDDIDWFLTTNSKQLNQMGMMKLPVVTNVLLIRMPCANTHTGVQRGMCIYNDN